MGFSGRIIQLKKSSTDYENVFAEVLPLLKTADFIFANLESVLIDDANASMFSSEPSVVKVLAEIGFNILSLANNHIFDYGERGLASTIDGLLQHGIHPLGAGNTREEAKSLHISERDGVCIGWLGCGRTLVNQNTSSVHYWEYDEDEILMAVESAKGKVDFLVMSIHIGLMYLDYPKPEVKAFAEKLLENGVDLILMHHAHVLQGVQMHQNGGICCYNLGNFLLDWKEGNVSILEVENLQTESAIFVFDIDHTGYTKAFALPVYFDDEFVVHWAEGMRGKRILDRLIGISEAIQGDYGSLFEQQRVERNTGPMIKVMMFHLRHCNFAYLFKQIGRIRLQHIMMFLNILRKS